MRGIPRFLPDVWELDKIRRPRLNAAVERARDLHAIYKDLRRKQDEAFAVYQAASAVFQAARSDADTAMKVAAEAAQAARDIATGVRP